MPRSSTLTRGQRILLGSGCALLAAAVLCNEWLLAWLLSSDGSIDDATDLTLIRLFQGICLLWGLLNVALYRRRLAAKLNLSLLALCLAAPLISEIAIRVGLLAGLPSFRRPGLYADPLSDDDYWKLAHLWSAESNRAARFTAAVVPHERLGWVPAGGPGNPLGLIGADRPRADAGGPPVLVFGDSFVEGNTADADRIPQIVDQLLADRPVYNLGVSGYGVDQIYLRLQHAHGHWEQPFVLIGMLTNDLDRSLLRFRERPKPYFELHGDQLVLQGVPVTLSNDQWIQRHPPAIPSFLWAFLQMRVRLHQPGPWRELSYRRREKIAVNARLLADMVEYCRQAELAFCFVIFYEPDELDYVGWRERFLLDQLRQLDAELIDTKPLLLTAAQRNNVSAGSYYQTDHHFNAAGNRLVAEAIARYLQAAEQSH